MQFWWTCLEYQIWPPYYASSKNGECSYLCQYWWWSGMIWWQLSNRGACCSRRLVCLFDSSGGMEIIGFSSSLVGDPIIMVGGESCQICGESDQTLGQCTVQRLEFCYWVLAVPKILRASIGNNHVMPWWVLTASVTAAEASPILGCYTNYSYADRKMNTMYHALW